MPVQQLIVVGLNLVDVYNGRKTGECPAAVGRCQSGVFLCTVLLCSVSLAGRRCIYRPVLGERSQEPEKDIGIDYVMLSHNYTCSHTGILCFTCAHEFFTDDTEVISLLKRLYENSLFFLYLQRLDLPYRKGSKCPDIKVPTIINGIVILINVFLN